MYHFRVLNQRTRGCLHQKNWSSQGDLRSHKTWTLHFILRPSIIHDNGAISKALYRPFIPSSISKNPGLQYALTFFGPEGTIKSFHEQPGNLGTSVRLLSPLSSISKKEEMLKSA